MPEVIAAVESELVKESIAHAECLCGEHLREAQLIQASLLPIKGLSTNRWRSPSVAYLFSRWEAILPTFSVARRFCRHLPR